MMVGLDGAKAELAVAVRPSGEQWTVAHDEPGVRALAERLRAVQPALIVCEATGGYELLSVGAGRRDPAASPRLPRGPRASWPRRIGWTRRS